MVSDSGADDYKTQEKKHLRELINNKNEKDIRTLYVHTSKKKIQNLQPLGKFKVERKEKIMKL